MLHINNPYLYHPHPLLKRAADDICLYISQHPDWAPLFEQGKMLGVLLVCDKEKAEEKILVAYSGVVNGLSDPDHYFVPPVYDLSHPDHFYMREDAAISEINQRIAQLQQQSDSAQQQPDSAQQRTLLAELQQQRRDMSAALQLKIFSHFNFCNDSGVYRNVVDIFADAKRGLPPGGAGECAAPRLLQYALSHHLEPIALAEFWYGRSPVRYRRVHGQFYPSCIEKCSPILSYMTGQHADDVPVTGQDLQPDILFENDRVVVLSKPAGLLSQPAKNPSQPNVEQWLKSRYPECRLPFMLVHRLDQATSGILIAAKDAQAHKELQQAFEAKRIHKRYLALLQGHVPSDGGVISLPICTNPDDRPRQVVDWQFGRQAITRYEVLQRLADGRTLIAFYPLTGRTHQLRLHAASPFGLGCPICGDTLYQLPLAECATSDSSNVDAYTADAIASKNSIFFPDRLCLHAEQITFPADLCVSLGLASSYHCPSPF